MGDGIYSVSDLEKNITSVGDRQLARLLDKLTKNGFLNKGQEKREESRRSVNVYSYVEFLEINNFLSSY